MGFRTSELGGLTVGELLDVLANVETDEHRDLVGAEIVGRIDEGYVLALQRQAVLNERRVALAEQRVADLEAAIREALDPGTPSRPRREVLREALGGKVKVER